MGRNNRRRLKRWCIVGVLAVMGLATLWHFLYEWLPCGFLSVFCPVNESPWEHVKLFYLPPLIWYVVMYFAAGMRYPNYLFACTVSLLVMPALMLLIYLGCRALGIDSLPAAIVNTLVCIAMGMWVVYRLTVSKRRLYGLAFTVTAIMIFIGLFHSLCFADILSAGAFPVLGSAEKTIWYTALSNADSLLTSL